MFGSAEEKCLAMKGGIEKEMSVFSHIERSSGIYSEILSLISLCQEQSSSSENLLCMMSRCLIYSLSSIFINEDLWNMGIFIRINL